MSANPKMHYYMNLARKAITLEYRSDIAAYDKHAVLGDANYTYVSHVLECLLNAMPQVGRVATEAAMQHTLSIFYSHWEE